MNHIEPFLHPRPMECTYMNGFAGDVAMMCIYGELHTQHDLETVLIQKDSKPLWNTLYIPESFIEKRPTVLFIPVTQTHNDVVDIQELPGMYSELQPLCSIEQMYSIVKRLQQCCYSLYNREPVYHQLKHLLHTYFTNMELYQLTQDQMGSVVRWGNPKDLTYDEVVFTKNSPWSHTYHPYYKEISEGRKTTHWFRHYEIQRPRFSDTNSVRMETTLEHLESYCDIGYDGLNFSTILAIQREF